MDVILLYLFVIGLFLGSFYNVVALRLSKCESILFPGSHCTNCNHRLSWYELIPVFSYIGLKGKCKECKMKISIQYPLIELLTGILFAFSYYLFGFSVMTLVSIVVSSIVIITIASDARFMVILDEVLIAGILILTLLYFFQGGIIYILKKVVSGVLLFLLMFFVKKVGDQAFKQESLGWGDVKLSFLAGYILGAKVGVLYIFVGAFLALPYALYISFKKKSGILPFGPFLASAILLLLWNMEYILTFLSVLLGGNV